MVKNAIMTTLAEADTSLGSSVNLCEQLWQQIEAEVAPVECDIFSYIPDLDSDPLSDGKMCAPRAPRLPAGLLTLRARSVASTSRRAIPSPHCLRALRDTGRTGAAARRASGGRCVRGARSGSARGVRATGEGCARARLGGAAALAAARRVPSLPGPLVRALHARGGARARRVVLSGVCSVAGGPALRGGCR